MTEQERDEFLPTMQFHASMTMEQSNLGWRWKFKFGGPGDAWITKEGKAIYSSKRDAIMSMAKNWAKCCKWGLENLEP